MHCPICGLPMVHSRLRGYHCHHEQHNDMAFDIAMQNEPLLTDVELDEIIAALEYPEATQVKVSTHFEERALEAMKAAAKRRAIRLS